MQMYNKGLSQYKLGNNLFIGGAAVTGVGIIGFIVGMPMMGEGNSPSRRDAGVGYVVGSGVAILSGVTLGIIGINKKSKGKELIDDAVNTYNGSKNMSHAELQFGVTHHGIGLVLNF